MLLDNLEFTNLYLGLWGLVGLIFWLIDYFGLFKVTEIRLPGNFISQNTSSLLKRLPVMILALIAWGAISVSLMGPRTPIGRSKATQKINDIYFVVDVSRSMLAVDFQPNRLEAAKNNIRKFIELSPVDRIGLILFADKVFTLIPATSDLGLVRQSVDQIKIGFLGSGTNIGDALGLAIARSTASIAHNKSIILLTDGASNVGLMSPQEAARKAQENKIKIHTIGIGGDVNAQMPISTNAFGRTRYRNIPGGSMDFKTLKEISEISGGKTFTASSGDALRNVLDEIDKLERKSIDVSGRVLYKELYWYFFVVGFFSLVAIESFRRYVYREAY